MQESKNCYTRYVESTVYLLYRFITLAFVYYLELITGKITISAKTRLNFRNGEIISYKYIIPDEATEMNKRKIQLAELV